MHRDIAFREALEAGCFRGQGFEHHFSPHVQISSDKTYAPLPTVKGGQNLQDQFDGGIAALETIVNPFEKAISVFLWGALRQFFFDGNKRTARMMMNGVLLTHGLHAMSVPASLRDEFNAVMCRFYDQPDASRSADEAAGFLVKCHPVIYRPERDTSHKDKDKDKVADVPSLTHLRRGPRQP